MMMKIMQIKCKLCAQIICIRLEYLILNNRETTTQKMWYALKMYEVPYPSRYELNSPITLLL